MRAAVTIETEVVIAVVSAFKKIGCFAKAAAPVILTLKLLIKARIVDNAGAIVMAALSGLPIVTNRLGTRESAALKL